MIEPVALENFFITFFSSALIILAGALYALLYAWSKVSDNRVVVFSKYCSWVVLLYSVYTLTQAANFSGYWVMISAAMVIGYFFAPILIWHLCKSTQNNLIGGSSE